MKFITLVLVLCSTVLFGQGITVTWNGERFVETDGIPMWYDSLGTLQLGFKPIGYSKTNWDSVYAATKNPIKTSRLQDSIPKKVTHSQMVKMWTSRGLKDTLISVTVDSPQEIRVEAGSGVRVKEKGNLLFIESESTLPTSRYPGDVYFELPATGPKITMTFDEQGRVEDITKHSFLITPDSIKFPRTIELPQPWADSTEWESPAYDPNFFFHKNHEWVYSVFEDLNEEYQKQYPYPVGGFEHQGRICAVCKTKQQRTKYFGLGKNPFKKEPTNSEYSKLLLQGRQ